jgi:hypothetical protein
MPAWWNSIDSVSTFSWAMRWIGIGLTVFGAICGGLALVATKRVETLKSERDAAIRVKAAENEKMLAELQAKTRDRHLTPGLYDDLTSFARKYRNHGLVIMELSGSNEEAGRLANTIAMAMQLGGWQVKRERVSLISGNPTYGLRCIANPRDTALASEFVNIFRRKDLRIELMEGADRKSPMVLDVGIKP